MKTLHFHVFSDKTVSADILYSRKGEHVRDGWHTRGISEKLSFGYNIFDTEFYNSTLKNIIEQIKTMDDLAFLGTQYKIPVPTVRYREIDSKNTGYRSEDMGLEHRSDLTFSEKLGYYKKNMQDFQQTYVYNCKNDRDIALSELHYYILHGYKLTHCELCEKAFYTKNLKNKYCLRKGFDSMHPEYSCKKIRALQRNTKCASDETKRIRKIIRQTLARVGADSDYSNPRLLSFVEEEEKYKQSHMPSEYEQWIQDKYREIVRNGGRKKAPDTNKM